MLKFSVVLSELTSKKSYYYLLNTLCSSHCLNMVEKGFIFLLMNSLGSFYPTSDVTSDLSKLYLKFVMYGTNLVKYLC